MSWLPFGEAAPRFLLRGPKTLAFASALRKSDLRMHKIRSLTLLARLKNLLARGRLLTISRGSHLGTPHSTLALMLWASNLFMALRILGEHEASPALQSVKLVDRSFMSTAQQWALNMNDEPCQCLCYTVNQYSFTTIRLSTRVRAVHTDKVDGCVLAPARSNSMSSSQKTVLSCERDHLGVNRRETRYKILHRSFCRHGQSDTQSWWLEAVHLAVSHQSPCCNAYT